MIHPAVPPSGALLRTSVMATHDPATLDRALETFAAAKRTFEVRARPAAGHSSERRMACRTRRLLDAFVHSVHKRPSRNEKTRSERILRQM